MNLENIDRILTVKCGTCGKTYMDFEYEIYTFGKICHDCERTTKPKGEMG